jgi:selenocysteine lyase/cysteine desulfurase
MLDDDYLAAEFPLDPAVIYLNHAGICPLPKRGADAIRRFVHECETQGARHYPRWMAMESRVREQLARLIHAPAPDDIALLKNTSEGLSTVAYGFPWQSGDNVIISDEEFPSNRIVWESLRHRGVSVREVSLSQTEEPEDALIAAANARTRMMAVSAVQFASGLRLNLVRLGALCHAREIAFCVDAIQALGAMHVDVQAAHIDFLAADAHKWLLGPEGIAAFYCAPPWRERLALHQFGWHMRENFSDYDAREWRPAPSARRFECGSPNMIGIHALSATLDLFAEIGMQTVERRVLARAEYLFDALQARQDLVCTTCSKTGRYAGIVIFNSNSLSADDAVKQLRNQGIICASRGGGIRFSPHFYTPHEQLDRALAAIPA